MKYLREPVEWVYFTVLCTARCFFPCLCASVNRFGTYIQYIWFALVTNIFPSMRFLACFNVLRACMSDGCSCGGMFLWVHSQINIAMLVSFVCAYTTRNALVLPSSNSLRCVCIACGCSDICRLLCGVQRHQLLSVFVFSLFLYNIYRVSYWNVYLLFTNGAHCI